MSQRKIIHRGGRLAWGGVVCSTWLGVGLGVSGLVAMSASRVSATPRQALSLTGEVKGLTKRVREGKIDVSFKSMPGGDMPSVLAFGVVKAPLSKVWAMITDCGRYHLTMPSVKDSALLSGSVKAGKMRCKIIADLPWPLDDLTSIVDVKIEVNQSGVHTRSWSLVEGDYKRNEGSWTLTPIDGGASTLLRYQLYVEPNTRVPDFLKRQAQKIKIPGLFKAIRAHVGAEG